MDHDLKRLATLDPARGREPTEAEWARSRARLATATAPRPRARRLVIGLAAATVLAFGAALTVPTMLPDGDAAYAAWSAVPESLPEPDAAAVAAQCARSWDTGGFAAGEVVLAERRGVNVLLIMWLRDGPLITCSSLGATGRPAGAQRLSDDRNEQPPRPPAGLLNLAGGMGATEGADGWYSDVSGRVGPDVTGVDVILPDGRTVRASVREGWWAAWWPGAEAGRPDAVRIVLHTAGGSRSFHSSELF